MSRGGRHKDRQVVERKCLATGEVRPTTDMIRFVVDPDHNVVVDVLGKLPGRGMWVTAERDAVLNVVKKGLFSRAAKQKTSCPEGLDDLVERKLVGRIQDLLALSRKSGSAVAGFEKVKSWLDQEKARVLIQASDGSGRGKGKLKSPEGKGTFIGSLTANELGLAFGRENVIHCALASGGLTKLVVEEAAKLKGFRGADGRKMPAKKDTKSR